MNLNLGRVQHHTPGRFVELNANRFDAVKARMLEVDGERQIVVVGPNRGGEALR